MICHLIVSVQRVLLFIQTTAAHQLDEYPVSRRTGDLDQEDSAIHKHALVVYLQRGHKKKDNPVTSVCPRY